jgi:hypothetical protein
MTCSRPATTCTGHHDEVFTSCVAPARVVVMLSSRSMYDPIADTSVHVLVELAKPEVRERIVRIASLPIVSVLRYPLIRNA